MHGLVESPCGTSVGTSWIEEVKEALKCLRDFLRHEEEVEVLESRVVMVDQPFQRERGVVAVDDVFEVLSAGLSLVPKSRSEEAKEVGSLYDLPTRRQLPLHSWRAHHAQRKSSPYRRPPSAVLRTFPAMLTPDHLLWESVEAVLAACVRFRPVVQSHRHHARFRHRQSWEESDG